MLYIITDTIISNVPCIMDNVSNLSSITMSTATTFSDPNPNALRSDSNPIPTLQPDIDSLSSKPLNVPDTLTQPIPKIEMRVSDIISNHDPNSDIDAEMEMEIETDRKHTISNPKMEAIQPEDLPLPTLGLPPRPIPRKTEKTIGTLGLPQLSPTSKDIDKRNHIQSVKAELSNSKTTVSTIPIPSKPAPPQPPPPVIAIPPPSLPSIPHIPPPLPRNTNNITPRIPDEIFKNDLATLDSMNVTPHPIIGSSEGMNISIERHSNHDIDDHGSGINEPPSKKQKISEEGQTALNTEQRHREKQEKRMQQRIKFLHEFRSVNDGKLPTLRGIMKLCSCGNEKAKQTITEYARVHDMTEKSVRDLMKVRNDHKHKDKKGRLDDGHSPLFGADGGIINDGQQHNVNILLRNIIFKILSCWRSEDTLNAYKHSLDLERNIKKYEIHYDALRLPGKIRMAESWFLLGTMRSNYKYIIRALKEFDLCQDGRCNENIFKKEEFDSNDLLPQCCGVYLTAANILFKHKKYLYASDIFRLAYNLAINIKTNDSKQIKIIENAKKLAKESLDALEKSNLNIQPIGGKDNNNNTQRSKSTSTISTITTPSVSSTIPTTINNSEESQSQSQSQHQQKKKKKLRDQGLVIFKIKNGNLFSAISHQIYGDTKYDVMIKTQCMEYMKSKFNQYSQLILDGTKGIDIKIFDAYCYRMLNNKKIGIETEGVDKNKDKNKDRDKDTDKDEDESKHETQQGANAEIIALSEMYQREIEVYINEDVPVLIEKPDKIGDIFLPPIKLAYDKILNEYHSIIDPKKNINIGRKVYNDKDFKINTESLLTYYKVLKDTLFLDERNKDKYKLIE